MVGAETLIEGHIRETIGTYHSFDSRLDELRSTDVRVKRAEYLFPLRASHHVILHLQQTCANICWLTR